MVVMIMMMMTTTMMIMMMMIIIIIFIINTDVAVIIGGPVKRGLVDPASPARAWNASDGFAFTGVVKSEPVVTCCREYTWYSGDPPEVDTSAPVLFSATAARSAARR
ncbi:hypothetical protein LSAT2_010343 [Lamellibrachia satsuma]|nr:hypothetical protein LSAT2_010343 [Lamellibrachia satsuma]